MSPKYLKSLPLPDPQQLSPSRLALLLLSNLLFTQQPDDLLEVWIGSCLHPCLNSFWGIPIELPDHDGKIPNRDYGVCRTWSLPSFQSTGPACFPPAHGPSCNVLKASPASVSQNPCTYCSLSTFSIKMTKPHRDFSKPLLRPI